MIPDHTMTQAEVETAETDYDDKLPGSWVVSGPLKPWTPKEIKSSTGRQHVSVQEARDGLEGKVRVLRDISQPHIGLWAFRVTSKPAHPDQDPHCLELPAGGVWLRKIGAAS